MVSVGELLEPRDVGPGLFLSLGVMAQSTAPRVHWVIDGYGPVLLS